MPPVVSEFQSNEMTRQSNLNGCLWRIFRTGLPALVSAITQNQPFRSPALITVVGSKPGWLQPKPAISSTGKGAGRKSQCEPLAEVIRAKIEGGLSAQRIYQDLVAENGFLDSYQSVRRFVCKLRGRQPERVWRVEVQPGEEVQVDFGVGAPIELVGARARRSWVLRMVLSYSRKGYSEASNRQDTETFLRCLENGLRSYGGVPLLLNLDFVPRNKIEVLCPVALCALGA
jgi:transposase